MEAPHLHEIVQPIKEVVASLGERALNWILPREALDMFVQNSSAEKTAPQLPLEEFGWDVVAKQPDRE